MQPWSSCRHPPFARPSPRPDFKEPEYLASDLVPTTPDSFQNWCHGMRLTAFSPISSPQRSHHHETLITGREGGEALVFAQLSIPLFVAGLNSAICATRRS